MRSFTTPKLLLCLLFTASTAAAQENVLVDHTKSLYSGVKKIAVRSAENMPEEHYAFKPVDSVRTYGQIVGHVADSQYYFCSAVLGEKNPALKIEKTKTTKAELIAALKDAFAYCDRAYEAMNDKTAVEILPTPNGPTPKLGILATSNIHTIEHYGNLVTYMRMKGIVPPTSEPGFIETLKKK